MRQVRFDTKVLGGYYCNSNHCKKYYVCMYYDPCWRPTKRFGKAAPRLGLSPANQRRNER